MVSSRGPVQHGCCATACRLRRLGLRVSLVRPTRLLRNRLPPSAATPLSCLSSPFNTVAAQPPAAFGGVGAASPPSSILPSFLLRVSFSHPTITVSPSLCFRPRRAHLLRELYRHRGHSDSAFHVRSMVFFSYVVLCVLVSGPVVHVSSKMYFMVVAACGAFLASVWYCSLVILFPSGPSAPVCPPLYVVPVGFKCSSCMVGSILYLGHSIREGTLLRATPASPVFGRPRPRIRDGLKSTFLHSGPEHFLPERSRNLFSGFYPKQLKSTVFNRFCHTLAFCSAFGNLMHPRIVVGFLDSSELFTSCVLLMS